MTLRCACLILMVVGGACAADLSFDIPAVPLTLDVSGQPLTITVSGEVAQESAQSFHLKLTADLTGLQSHITPLLAAQLNQSNKCGERIVLERASLTPDAPHAKLTAQVHVEKWACIKAFGRENATKLVSGDATINMTLAPRVGEDTVKLDAEIGGIDADGTLGQLLHSDFGNVLRDKICESLRRAIEKSAGMEVMVPQQVKPFVTVQSVEFAERGTGILLMNLAGHASVPVDLAPSVLDQFRGRR